MLYLQVMTKIVSILTLLLTLSSCNFISSFIHDDEVVARVGNEKLYLSELSSYIPDTVSPEDSTNLAMQYITSWARDLLYLNLAENQLSKAEQDVSSELEDYRRSLLRYRYEQLYVNDRLDTLITDAQIESYYKEHEDYFKLQRPILKVRFLDIMSDSPNAELIIRCMSSDDYSEVLAADIRHKTGLYLSNGKQYGKGGERFLRMNIACPRATLLDGLERLRRALT